MQEEAPSGRYAVYSFALTLSTSDKGLDVLHNQICSVAKKKKPPSHMQMAPFAYKQLRQTSRQHQGKF